MKATELNELINEAIKPAGKRTQLGGVTVEQAGKNFVRAMHPAGNVEQSMGERAAEKADFWKDVEREMDCA